MDCIFCKIIKGEIPCAKVFENEYVIAFLDIAPLSEGHTLIIPKEHYATMAEMPEALAAELGKVLPRISTAVCKSTGTSACNIFQNNGRAAGQEVDHLHFHIVPRIEGDGIFKLAKQAPYAEGRMHAVAEIIKEQLS